MTEEQMQMLDEAPCYNWPPPPLDVDAEPFAELDQAGTPAQAPPPLDAPAAEPDWTECIAYEAPPEPDPWADVDPEWRPAPTNAEAGMADDAQAERLADSLMRRYRTAQQRIRLDEDILAARLAELEAEATRLRERHEEIVKPQTRRLEYLDAFWRPWLEQYATLRLQGAKSRTLKLLDGKLSFHKGTPRLEITDEISAIQWASALLPEAIVTTVSKATLKKHATTTGEVPAGTVLVPGEDKFEVKADI